MKNPSSTVGQNYFHLITIWANEQMQSAWDFLELFTNNFVVPALEALKKMIDFCHSKWFYMLKLGFLLPKSAKTFLLRSKNFNFSPFFGTDKDLLGKKREDIVAGRSTIFTCTKLVDETCTRKSTILCKFIVSIDASQVYRNSMCQSWPTGFFH